MKFLYPTGGVEDDAFGVLITPGRYGVSSGIRQGLPWAADNEAYTRGFDPARFFPWLESMAPYRDTCLFVAVPDVVGDAIATLHQWRNWVHHFEGWPVAFVAQDGQECLSLPSYFDVLFIGGSIAWKEGPGAVTCIERARARHKRIHIGCVNYGDRYNSFRVLEGSDDFTCDGTRPRYEGKDRAVRAWKGYMAQPPLVRLYPGRTLPGRDCGR